MTALSVSRNVNIFTPNIDTQERRGIIYLEQPIVEHQNLVFGRGHEMFVFPDSFKQSRMATYSVSYFYHGLFILI